MLNIEYSVYMYLLYLVLVFNYARGKKIKSFKLFVKSNSKNISYLRKRSCKTFVIYLNGVNHDDNFCALFNWFYWCIVYVC